MAMMLPLIAVTLIVIGGYYLNQIYDYESDRINRKLGFLQSGMIGRSEMMAAYLAATLTGLIIGFYSGFQIGLINISQVILAAIYSLPPFRLKDRPYLGLAANILGYGIILPLLPPTFWENFETARLVIPAYFGLTVAAEFLLTIIPDREGDKKTGKTTLSVIFSNRILILSGAICFAAAVWLAGIAGLKSLTFISLTALILYLTTLLAPREGLILFVCKFPILLITLLAGYYFPAYLVFIVVLLLTTRLYYKKRLKKTYPRLN